MHWIAGRKNTMPGNPNLLLFLTASLVVIVAPGPDNILVLTRGVTLGVGRRWSRRRARASGW